MPSFDENQRLLALHSYKVLDTAPEEEFDRLTELASLVCKVPITLVSLVDKERQWFKSKIGIQASETPRNISFCQYAILGNEIFIVEDAANDTRFKDTPLVTGQPHIRFYAGCPLIDPNGYALGTLCVIDSVARKLDANQLRSLSLIANEVVSQLIARKNRVSILQSDVLFQMSIDLLVIAGIDGYFKKVNPAFAKLLGWSEEVLLKNPFVEFIHPDDLKSTFDEVEKLSKGQLTINFVNRYKTKTGEYKTINWTANPNIQNGEIYGVGRDITEKSKIEGELIKTKELLEQTNKVARIGTWEFDLINNKTNWSHIAKEIHGILPDKDISLETFFDLYKSGENKNQLMQIYKKIIANGGEFDQELIIENHYGKEIWVKAIGKAEIKAGRCVRIFGTFQEITEKKILELEVQKNQNRLMEAQKISKLGNWEFNLITKELIWSSELYRIFEIDEKVDSNQLFQIYRSRIMPNDLVTLDGLIENSIKTGLGYKIEHEAFFDNGNRKKYILGIAEIIKDATGAPLILRGIAQDITERKLIQEKLKINEERWQYAFEASGDGLWEWDPIHKTTFYSNRWLSMLGYSMNEFSNKDTEWSSRLHPDDINMVFAQINENLAGKTNSFMHEYRFLNKKGDYVWILNRGKVVERDRNGIATRVIGTHTDISLQKLAEEKLLQKEGWIRTLISSMDDLVFVLDKNYVFKEYFQKPSDLLYVPPEHFVGKHFFNVGLPLETANIIKIALDKCVESKNSQKVEYSLDFPQGKLWFDLRVSCVFDNNNNISDIICVARDITNQKKIELEIVHSKELAISANMAKSEFLANMSHEIRTPLNGVIGFCDLLMGTKLDITQQLYISTINNSANLLLGIINDILDFSKIEAGKLEIENQQMNFEQLLIDTVNIVSYQCQSKKLELLLNISPNIPQYIWTDSIRLRQILINLLGNAIKFTSQGEIELKVEVISQKKNSTVIKFSVRDTGIGINQNKIKSIFSPFSQEDSSITRKFGGTGLGLSISNKLLRIMKGTSIQVSSIVGKGSVFYFEIEFISQGIADAKYDNLESFKNILVVSQNDASYFIIKQILSLPKINVDRANGIDDSVLSLNANPQYDAIILDFDVSEINGHKFINDIRSSNNPIIQNLPIIVICAAISDLSSLYQLESHNIQLIFKPINSHALLTALTKFHHAENSDSTLINTYPKLDNLESKNILIVDDNKVNILLCKTIIKKILPKSNIIEAFNGEEAVSIFRSNRLDLIFMDIQMPKLNGYEATKEIRKLEKNSRVPVIALTAGTLLGEKERCMEAGMDDYISKPFVKDAIAQVVGKFLGTLS